LGDVKRKGPHKKLQKRKAEKPLRGGRKGARTFGLTKVTTSIKKHLYVTAPWKPEEIQADVTQ